MRHGPFGMVTERSRGVHSMSRDRKLRCEILGSPRSSVSLGAPRILCYGSTPCPKARFPEEHHLRNDWVDMEAGLTYSFHDFNGIERGSNLPSSFKQNVSSYSAKKREARTWTIIFLPASPMTIRV